MALQDHFHDPLRGRRHWQGFHQSWATLIALDLNRRLPERYFAEPSVQFGIEIDVSTWEDTGRPTAAVRGDVGGESRRGWTPPAPTQTVPFTLVTDAVEVQVFDTREGPVLVGAVELVSPANKDRPETREAFVAKCKALLQAGLGLVLVDIVTERKANLHADLLGGESQSDLYATAYRPVGHEESSSLEIWSETLAVGRALPTLPLWLRGGPCMPLDLESTYEQARVGMRLPG